MDERTLLNFATFHDAIMKTNHDYGRDKYFYVVIFIIILLIGVIIFMYVKPKTITEIRYVPYFNQEKNQLTKENFSNIQNNNDKFLQNQYQVNEIYQIPYSNNSHEQNMILPNNNYNYNLI